MVGTVYAQAREAVRLRIGSRHVDISGISGELGTERVLASLSHAEQYTRMAGTG